MSYSLFGYVCGVTSSPREIRRQGVLTVGGVAPEIRTGHVICHMGRVDGRALCVFTDVEVIQVGDTCVKLKKRKETCSGD